MNCHRAIPRSGVTREWVGVGEVPKERTEVAEAVRCADRGHIGRDRVEAGGRKGQENDDESRGAPLSKSKALVRKEVDLKECHIVKEAEEVENAEKLQVPRQGKKAEAKEHHNTGVDDLLIKIAESEGLRVDAGELDQGTK
ncbi:hypothetical protein B296_00007498 [Ensete ventricosum]|uniref:Uncharacterized protein n=1 Tax=Ensete ventricosum TaxID=4639 RepID=A0A427ABW6_ENSVE|nr:hypothetical protein B296_00007498 [Ensete ventricosum]